jgi:hypothetical protein
MVSWSLGITGTKLKGFQKTYKEALMPLNQLKDISN